MKEIIDFLNKAGTYYLATVEGDQPRVRPIGFVMDCGGKLAFCTGNTKPMYKQMVENPKVEISAFDGSSIMRITGKAVFATTAQTQQQALDVMPGLKGLYAVGDGVFEIFYLDEGKAVCASMSGDSSKEWVL